MHRSAIIAPGIAPGRVQTQPPEAQMARVLIVDDSALMRRAISQMLGKDERIEIVGTARDGQEGLEKARDLKPDLITLDIEMPRMDGLEALRRIRLEVKPKPAVLMCSSLTTAGSHEALKALRLGAVDVIGKDPAVFGKEPEEVRRELCSKIHAIVGGHKAQANIKALGATVPLDRPAAAEPVDKRVHLDRSRFDVVAIGSSTGGPPVIETVFEALPAVAAAPVVVAQHMPPVFTKCLSERLDQGCAVRVIHVDRDMPLAPGVVHIIVGGKHGHIERTGARLYLRISDEPADAYYKPSVDALLSSAALACGRNALGVVFTGMGDDGARGAQALKGKGGTVITQRSDTCVIYGMPKAVVEAGVSDAAMSPKDIGAALANMGRAARASA